MKQLVINTRTGLEMMRFLSAILLAAIFAIPGCAAGTMCLISITKIKIIASLFYGTIAIVCLLLALAIFVLRNTLDD